MKDWDLLQLVMTHPDKKRLITFAGPPGTSKTPIAFHLSYTINLPMLNSDAIRSEVLEDFGGLIQEEFERRRNKRLQTLIERGTSFILDASIDREWKNYGHLTRENGYSVFIISMDLSQPFIEKLYRSKGYTAIASLPTWMQDHERFLAEYGHLVNFRITDETFPDRLSLCTEAIKNWLYKFT